MSAAKPNIVLVTPVYRDATRLSVFGPSLARALAAFSRPILWVVADDGSEEGEVARTKALVDVFREVHPDTIFFSAGEHHGKGGTIRRAWAEHPDAQWLGFVDADGSVSAESLMSLVEKAIDTGPGHAVLGSRMPSPHTTVSQGIIRKIAHKTFALIARTALSLPVRDVQCGAKFVDGVTFRKIRSRLVEDGFAFDSELLIALKKRGVRLVEVPVDWAEKSGGSVSPFVHAGPMLSALLQVRRRSRSGYYDPS